MSASFSACGIGWRGEANTCFDTAFHRAKIIFYCLPLFFKLASVYLGSVKM
jgi:hypothetical protein